MANGPVHELRLALTVSDFAQAVAFYRDTLGLPMIEFWDESTGSGAILDAGRVTLELLSERQAELVDDVEVGRRTAGPVRIALEVTDSKRTAQELAPPVPV
jgi:lactoylglutathione lyase